MILQYLTKMYKGYLLKFLRFFIFTGSKNFFYLNIFCPIRVNMWDEILPNVKRLESMGYEVQVVSSDGKNRHNVELGKNFTNAGMKMQYAIRVYY